MKKNKKQSLLWELTPKGSSAKSYVFGTMHVRDYRAFIYQDIITEYIDACKVFAAEFDLRERAQLTSEDISKLPNNYRLQTLLGDHRYNRLRKIILKSFRVELDNFATILPIFIVNMLTEKVLINSKSIPLDTFLWQYAENTHRDLKGVESFAEQLITLDKIPLNYQLGSLVEIGNHPKKFRKQIKSLIDMYVKNDLKGLYKKSKKSLGKQKKLLLYNRNFVMAQRTKAMILLQTSFIAIGAAHLGGKKGVISLLKQADILCRPVFLDVY